MITQLPLPKSGQITEIIHCSDIHIRRGDSLRSRKEEYLEVFNNLTKDISELESIKQGTAVIVCTGDVFHDYENLNPNTINVFASFVDELIKLAPMYIIQGNHDFKSTSASDTDSIQCCVIVPRTNLVYLNSTGLYQAGNVTFGLVAEHDVLDPSTTSGKQVDELPKFPNAFPINTHYKIALFHGTVRHCHLDNYKEDTMGYPLEWFSGYDAVLLGHIHLQQIYNAQLIPDSKIYKWADNKLPWAYPGSLIQQGLGENLHGHGFLVWNLPNKTITKRHVYNPIGKMYVKYNKADNTWTGFLNHEYINLNEIFQLPFIPKKMLIITIKDRYPPTALLELTTLLDSLQGADNYRITNTLAPGCPDIERYDIESIGMIDDSLIGELHELNSTQTFIDYIENQSKDLPDEFRLIINQPDFLLIDDNSVPLYLNNIVNSCNLNINKKINSLKDTLSKIQTGDTKQSLKFLYLEWDWILSYGSNNWYDFTKLDGCIGLVDGPNDFGKSSLMEIICFSLFGIPLPSRSGHKSNDEILSFQKPYGETAKTIVKLKLGQDQYILIRKFTPNKNGTMQKHKELYTFNPETKTVNLKCSEATVDVWIKTNVGEIDNFLLSCMMTQYLDQDFFSLKKEQPAIIDSSLNLEYIPSLLDLLNETRLRYKSLVDHMKSSYTQYSNSQIQFDQPKYEQLFSNIQRTTTEISALETLNDTLNGIIMNVTPEIRSLCNKTLPQLENELTMSKKNMNTINLPNYNLTAAQNELIEIKSKLNPIMEYVDESTGKTSTELKKLIENLTIVYKPESNEVSVAKKITEFKSKFNVTELEKHINDLPKNTELLKTYKANYENIQTTLSRHRSEFPQRSDKSKAEYTKWLTINKQFSKITDAEIKNLQQFCTENPLVKPSTSLTSINSLQSSIEQFRIKLKQKHWIDCIGSLFTKETTHIIKQYTSVKTQLDGYNKHKNDIECELELCRKNMEIDNKKLQNLVAICPPSITYEDVDKWLSNYINSEKNYEIYLLANGIHEELEKSNRIISENEQLLKNIMQQHKETPYNPDCWACQKTAWRLHINQIDDTIKEHKLNIEKLSLDLNKHKVNNKIPQHLDTSNFLKTFQIMTPQLPIYQRYKKLHTEYVKYNEQASPLKTLISQHQAKIQQLTSQLSSINDLIKNTQSKLNEISDIYEEVQICTSNRPTWLTNIALINEQTDIHNKYNNNYTQHVKKQNLDKYLNEKSEWDKELIIISNFEKWQNQLYKFEKDLSESETLYKNLLSLIDRTTNYINAKKDYDLDLHEHIKWTKWRDYNYTSTKYNATCYHYLKIDLETTINDIMKHQNLSNHIEKLISAIALKPKFIQKNDNDATLKKLQIELSTMQQEYARQEVIKSQQTQARAECQKLLECVQMFTGKSNHVSVVSQLANDYKYWIYKEKLIPKILNHVNKIAHLLNRGWEYNLEADIDVNEYKSNHSTVIKWFINDGVNRVRVIRNGGFRYFLFGLAMRITLSYLGCASIRCSQLFLDEGFVSADRENLEMIPQLIRNLLQLYNSILVVSHLPILKENIDIRSSIIRNNKISLIQFGDKCSYEFKKKGRKPTTIAQNTVPINCDEIETSIILCNEFNDSQIIEEDITVQPEPQIITVVPTRLKCQQITKSHKTPCTKYAIYNSNYCKIHSSK